jgi:iron complex transport system ATP-binding protein
VVALETKDGCALKIEIRGLEFSYPNGRPIFTNLNMDIIRGRILSVLGPNGAGKSTLLGCISRLHLPTKGDVLVAGRSYRTMSHTEIARAIGFVPQNILPSFDYSVIDYVVTGLAPRMRVFQKPKDEEYEAAWRAIESMRLEHIAEKSFMRISSGERQQVAIARVIAQDPRFILLDEPTAYLDVGNQIRVLRILKGLADRGYGVVITTHNPDHVLLLGGDVAVIDRQGDFTCGPGKEILNEEFLSRLYGTQLRILEIGELQRKVCVAPNMD